MDISDHYFVTNRDWDPSYLQEIVSQDFYDFKDLWQSNMCDRDLVQAAERIDRYMPVVEDISIDDNTLYDAVEQIENE